MSDLILKVYFCGGNHQKQENKIHLFVFQKTNIYGIINFIFRWFFLEEI